MLKRIKLINLLFIVVCALATAWVATWATASGSFSNQGFMPHGHCYLWTPSLVYTMVVSDLLIGFAYLSISVCLYILVKRIQLPFSAMFLAFGAFIAACGGTHFMEVYTLWVPNYWASALVKVITAAASVATALIMFPLFPKVIEFAAAARLSEERRKQLQLMNDQLAEANRLLEAKTDELIASNRELETFSYSVSHDLRAPLRSIDGFSGILTEDYSGVLEPQGREYLGHIRNSAQRMGQIIDDLLSLSHLARVAVKKAEVNLSLLARETIRTLQVNAPDRKVEIFVHDGLLAHGDGGLLTNLLENLLSNAWKFTSKASGARIEFGAQNENGHVAYFVRDNGAGFEMRYSDKLFNPFQRLHSREDYAGTGIGLATARRVVERHGGKIWAESEVGKGTTFYFTLGD